MKINNIKKREFSKQRPLFSVSYKNRIHRESRIVAAIYYFSPLRTPSQLLYKKKVRQSKKDKQYKLNHPTDSKMKNEQLDSTVSEEAVGGWQKCCPGTEEDRGSHSDISLLLMSPNRRHPSGTVQVWLLQPGHRSKTGGGRGATPRWVSPRPATSLHLSALSRRMFTCDGSCHTSTDQTDR